jgi:CRP-like cAMP-binding protein
MAKTEILSDSAIRAKLMEVDIFSALSSDETAIESIRKICRTRRFSRGRNIINEGTFGDELFIVVSGEIDILKKTLQNEKYTVTTLKADMGGIYVGELALIDNDRRSASVIAKSDCQCIVINRDDFIELGDQNPSLGLSITRAIARQISLRLRKTNDDVITLFSALVDEIAAENC